MKVHNTNGKEDQVMKLQCGCPVDDFEGTLLNECTDHMQANFMN